ncbi:MAG: bifunctional riboflavin kinase/FMN adenylyltransferase [Planctomycetota bacterium]
MPSILTIGNFDGVHRGHRALIDHARTLAKEHVDSPDVVALTFDPPPAAMLKPDVLPPQLCTLDLRRQRLLDAGADRVEVLPVTPELLALSPEGFIDRLVQQYDPVAFVEGENFHFGKKRAGDMAWLADYGKSQGFTAHTVPPVTTELHDQHRLPVSSSLCRWLIGRGRVADAAQCLGDDPVLEAAVVKGEQRGRTLGIPTANLDPAELDQRIVPTDGVYAGWATIGPEIQRLPAAISIGVKPTFGVRQLTVEAHLPTYTGPEFYGSRLTLGFARWLRDQYPFPSLNALTDQLKRDIEQSRIAFDAA